MFKQWWQAVHFKGLSITNSFYLKMETSLHTKLVITDSSSDSITSELQSDSDISFDKTCSLLSKAHGKPAVPRLNGFKQSSVSGHLTSYQLQQHFLAKKSREISKQVLDKLVENRNYCVLCPFKVNF